MKVLVAGATGALGKQLVPRLVARGHEVVGMTRSESKRDAVTRPRRHARGRGRARPRTGGARRRGGRARGDRPPADRAVRATRPAPLRPHLRADQPAAHGGHRPPAGRRPRGRDAAGSSPRATPAGRSPATGGPVKTEDDPLDPLPPDAMRETLDAIRYLEDAVTGADWTEGIVLRYGGFYGPGTSLGPEGGEHGRDDPQAQVPGRRRRRRRLVVRPHRGRGRRDGGGDSSTAARGIYNIVDDEPAPVAEWLPDAGSRRRRASRRATCRAGSAGCSPARPRRS